jgi:hypothetical protein
MFQVIEGPGFQWHGQEDNTRGTREALSVRRVCSQNEAFSQKEALIGDNNLRPISFLEMGTRRARCVTQVIVTGLGLGTGFLIAPNLLLTNNHVIPSADHARQTLLRFNYETDASGQLMASSYYNCAPDTLFVTSEALDYTLVGVQGDPGMQFGFVPPYRTAASVGMRVNIIQHPGGQPKQIGLVDNEVAYADAQVVQYLTDTMPGSSGSPVFDDGWALVALHHSGGWIPEPNGTSTHFRNEGIAFAAILDDWARLGLIS